ncbi:myb-like protein X [Pistacia vera]|uniref:myb-like protein X n=1 Tax=Pistacia vera TaxID=55513 RepID=UPI001263ACB1|nr:myb-like protein X [Pistacia vera]
MVDQSSELEVEKIEQRIIRFVLFFFLLQDSETTQKVDEDLDAKKQNIEGCAAENNFEASETADFISSKENQSMEDTKEGLLSSTVEKETVEESSQENEIKAVKLKEEVDELSSAFIQKIEETNSRKETVSETLKDSAESNVNSSPKEINECLVEKSSLVLEASEEIKANEETTISDSDSVSVAVATEEMCLKETEPGEEKQVECLGPAFEEKSIIGTETKETMVENVDIDEKPVDISNLGEKSDKEIPTAAAQATEKIENIKENEVPHAGSEDKKDATTDEMPLEETSEEVECSSTTSKEQEFMTSEAKETTNPSNVSELEPVDTEKEPANEEVQKERFEDLYVHPELDEDKPLSVSEDVEISKREEARELADHTDDCTSKTLEDVESSIPTPTREKTEDANPVDEALKSTGTSVICTEIGKDILEKEIFEGKEGVEVEKEVIEQKGEANSQRQEEIDTKYTAEEIVKSADRDQMLQHASEAGAEDESNEILHESHKNQTEENCSDIQNQENENEIHEKEELKLEADDGKEQNANETIKAVNLAEEALEGVEQSNDSEDIKEPVVEEEHGINELPVLSIVGERTDEVQDSSPVYSEYTSTVDSKEKTETESSKVEESSISEREASFIKQSEEQKVQDCSIEPPAESDEKIKDITESSQNHNATLTTVTETILGEAQLHDKLVTDQGEPCPETNEIEYTQQGKEVNSMKIEETSSDLTSELQTKDLGLAKTESITVENIVTGEPEEIKIVSAAVYESKGQGAEENDFEKSLTVEKLDQVPANDHNNAEKKNEATENLYTVEAEENKVASNAVDETQNQGSEGTAETRNSQTIVTMDQVPSSNCEHADDDSPMLETPNADEVNEAKVVGEAISESNDQGTEESGESPSVEKLDYVPTSNSEDVVEGDVREENPETDGISETKIALDIVYQSKEQGTNDSDETGKSPTAEKPDADKSEEACKETADNGVIGAQGIDPVAKDEIAADQTPLAEKLEERILTLTSELPFEHGATTTVENIEEEKTEKMVKLEDEGPEDSSAAKSTEEISSHMEVSRELEVSTLGLTTNKIIEESPTELHREESQTPDGDIQLEHPEDENKIKCIDSLSESKDIVDVARPTEKACDLKSETSEKAFESFLESDVSDMRAEEIQCQKTSEASKEEIKEEKEVAETYQPNSLSEEKMKEGLQEDELKPGECTGEKINIISDTTVTGSQAEELPMETGKATASETIIEQVDEDRSLEDPDRVSAGNKITKESFPNESTGKNVEESAIKLDSINQESFENGMTGARTEIDEECNTEILQKESFEEFEGGSKLIQETQKSEETSFATSEKQITREANTIDCPETLASIGNEHVPPVLQEGILETSQNVEAEDFTKGVRSEAKEVRHGEDIIKESTLVDSDKALSSNLFQKSTKVDEDVKKEREPTGGKEEMQNEEAESYEEEGDEHKKTDSGSDAPVMVEASRDMEVKVVAHKKSILSGVGSKVKHSISKVKKAITGKSSHHSKPVSPK